MVQHANQAQLTPSERNGDDGEQKDGEGNFVDRVADLELADVVHDAGGGRVGLGECHAGEDTEGRGVVGGYSAALVGEQVGHGAE
jgi:hypothetical protein